MNDEYIVNDQTIQNSREKMIEKQRKINKQPPNAVYNRSKHKKKINAYPMNEFQQFESSEFYHNLFVCRA